MELPEAIRSAFFYDKWFPNVRKEGRGKPNHSDFDLIKNEIKKVMEPVKSHRDTVVAHIDPKPNPTTPRELAAVFSYLEGLLGDFFFICTFVRYVFELGGYAANVGQTAELLASVILNNEA